MNLKHLPYQRPVRRVNSLETIDEIARDLMNITPIIKSKKIHAISRDYQGKIRDIEIRLTFRPNIACVLQANSEEDLTTVHKIILDYLILPKTIYPFSPRNP